jgi:hypothetical protein
MPCSSPRVLAVCTDPLQCVGRAVQSGADSPTFPACLTVMGCSVSIAPWRSRDVPCWFVPMRSVAQRLRALPGDHRVWAGPKARPLRVGGHYSSAATRGQSADAGSGA